MDGIAQGFHRERAFRESGQIIEICDRTQTEYEMIVLEIVMMMVETMRYSHSLAFEVN
jgi:hypothetical protein